MVKVAVYGLEEVAMEAYQESLLEQFNAASDEYVCEYEIYSVEDRNRLIAEISSSNAPDLVLFYTGLPLSPTSMEDRLFYTDSAYFEDLYTCIDTDPELSRESFLPNLLESISSGGRLTQLWPYVEILTIMARTSEVGDGKGLRPGDYNAMVENNDWYAAVFEYGMRKEVLLRYISTVSVSAYTDKENAVCSFDDESFAGLLQWCKEKGSDLDINNPPAVFPYHLPETLLYVTVMAGVRSADSSSIFKEPHTYVGFPVGASFGSYYVSTGVCMAIPAMGSNKEGAWSYIRSQLEPEAQLQAAAEPKRMPVNYETFQRLAATELKDEDYEKLIDLVNNTTVATNYSDEPLRQIILSSGMAYLAGDKSLEATVSEIQSRASIYMAEKYG